jgi:hypothetical protein
VTFFDAVATLAGALRDERDPEMGGDKLDDHRQVGDLARDASAQSALRPAAAKPAAQPRRSSGAWTRWSARRG